MILATIRQNFTGILGSQLAEDCFNHMKNHRLLKSKKKYRKPTKCMSAVLASKVLSQVHDYKEVDVVMAPEERSVKLSKEVFQATKLKPSLPFHKIVSTSSTVPWYSPGAANWSCASADLDAILYAHKHNSFAALQHTWFGTFVRPDHQLLLRRASGDPTWYFGTHAWNDSAFLAFPASCGKLPMTDGAYWVADMSKPPVFLTMLALEDWVGVVYKWRTPAWQVAACAAAGSLPASLRAFSTTGEPKPFLTVAAMMAFWSVEKSTLTKLSSHLGLALPEGGSLMDTVWGLMKHCLPAASDEEIVQLCCKRVASFDLPTWWSDELLEVEEAAAVLERSDEQEIQKQKEKVASVLGQAQSFRSEFKAKAAAVAKAAAKSHAKRRRNTRDKTSTNAADALPERIPPWPEHNIDLHDARRCIPPGASLWRDVKFGSWQGHYPPYRRIGRSWRKYGEKESLRLVLEYLWEMHLLGTGQGIAACPIAGIHAPAA